MPVLAMHVYGVLLYPRDAAHPIGSLVPFKLQRNPHAPCRLATSLVVQVVCSSRLIRNALLEFEDVVQTLALTSAGTLLFTRQGSHVQVGAPAPHVMG